ncbi:superoxide dismutase, Mn [uncultured Paludibacter sp.]|nr:superoxide dismutase, Mn [uncultured Paludibacter sp.]
MKKIRFLFILLSINYLSAFGQFTLPPLPYSYGALEPYIDSTTMRIHYTAHHAAYVNNLNKALENYPDLQKKDIITLLRNITTLPKEIQTAVRNNGGGYYNHSLFWTMLAPAGTTKMNTELEKAFITNFGSVEKFKELFEKEATSRFGSGWVWLVKTKEGKLEIVSTPNQDNMYMPFNKIKGKPILALDVWEHAYYLKYQSKRAAYAKAFWNVVNWQKVAELYQ